MSPATVAPPNTQKAPSQLAAVARIRSLVGSGSIASQAARPRRTLREVRPARDEQHAVARSRVAAGESECVEHRWHRRDGDLRPRTPQRGQQNDTRPSPHGAALNGREKISAWSRDLRAI